MKGQKYSANILIGASDAARENTPVCIPVFVPFPWRPNDMPPLHIPKECLPPVDVRIEVAQKWVTLPGKNGKEHRFPQQTILPKVVMDRVVPPKQLPKDVELDRRRKAYARLNLEELLEKAGIAMEDLMPTDEQYQLLSELSFQHFLPLSFFDDTNFGIHSPNGWMEISLIDGKQYSLPARAFLPKDRGLLSYSWQYAAMTLCDGNRNMWYATPLADDDITYEIPEVQFMFLAENPHVYVRRLQSALAMRNNAECLIKLDMIIDCVLLQGLHDSRFLPHKRVDKLFAKLGAHVQPEVLAGLRCEVYLVFERLMAYYEFEKFITLMPKEFPLFSSDLIRNALPRAFHSATGVSAVEEAKQLHLDMAAMRLRVLRTTLFYVGAGIEAMMRVAIECQYIETLCLFVWSFSKPLTLADFLVVQQQNSTTVSTYLKSVWPQRISLGICVVLRALGKGWLDITLHKWTVYQMCKITRFILQVKLRMQESMQELLETSIQKFTHLLCQPCLQFLSLPADWEWPANDYINTPFPWPNPVFSMIIGISEMETVFYSTPPEIFEPLLMEVFKKSLEKTSGVRCIDAETLTNLSFAPNLFIQTVELIEDMYVQCDALLQNCYHQANIPLLAYARLFERFIPFYLLDVNDYLRAYAEAKKPSSQVKADILEHKRQKQELRDILPAIIVIGPFHINVDLLKQYMIKKHIDIIRKLFEYYVSRMYDTNELLLEQCVHINHKITERPQSIEHLYAIRDYCLEVPEHVEQLRADIQVMFLEYELLESFFYSLSDQQFTMKWEAYAWPHNILQRLGTLRDEQKNDVDEFKRIHLSECIGFEERLESLNEEVQAFSLIFDPNKVVETAVDVKKTWRIVQDLQKHGRTLQFRQKLFDMEDLSVEFLDSIIESFTPYRNLWGGCSDFIKLEEATIGNPLVGTDLAEVWQALDDIRVFLTAAAAVFEEKPEVQNVAIAFLDRIRDFEPVWNCMKWLKNEHWLLMHWQELGARSGMELKYSPAMNFQYLMRKGIMEHLDLVRDMSAQAETDADALRKAQEEEERRKEEERMAILMRKQMRKCRTDIV